MHGDSCGCGACQHDRYFAPLSVSAPVPEPKPAQDWERIGDYTFHDRVSGKFRDTNTATTQGAAAPMTTPPIDLNGFVDPNAAKQMLYQHLQTFLPANSPQYFNAAQAVSQHVDSIVAGETAIALTGRRIAELAAASQTYLGTPPEQRATDLARQQLVAEGRAADATKLPDHYRQRLAQTGATDEDIIEVATGMYPNLSRKDAVAKWTEVAAKTMAEPEPVNVITNPWTGSIKGQVFGNAG